MASALDSERTVRVRALGGEITLCSSAKHFTLTVPVSTLVYKWLPAKLMLLVALRWTSIPSRGRVALRYRNRDKHRQYRPWPDVDFTHLLTLFLFKAHFHKAPTVAARSWWSSEDLDVIN